MAHSAAPSPTPAPPARVRVAAHPPLAPLRAWVPLLAPAHARTVRDLSRAVSRLLNGQPDVELALQGFALLPDSPLSVIDPVNDIIDVTLAPAPLPPMPGPSPATPAPAPVAAILLPLPESPAASSSSSSSSSSSASSSDDDDDAPETLSSKRPLANGHGPNGSVRPAKRARTSSVSSSSSATSSLSSSSSSSSSSASSSDSDSESDTHAALDPLRALARLVPPGQGKRRTRKRNERKRKLRSARAHERAAARLAVAREEGEDERGEDEAMQLDRASSPPAARAQAPVLPPAATPVFAQPVIITAPPVLPSPPRAPTPPPPTISTPPALSTGGEPGISLIGPGRGAASAAAQRQTSSRRRTGPAAQSSGGYFNAPQPAAASSSAAGRAPLPPARDREGASPAYRPASPDVSYASALPEPAAAPALPEGKPSSTPQSAKKAPTFVPPSRRTDLPPWMVVSRVNVEAREWEAGVGRIVRGTSRDWVPGAAAAQEEEMEESEGEEEGWEGWRSRDEVESGWDRWTVLRGQAAAKPGLRVAIKVLELDPSTFAPALALKYGRLRHSSTGAEGKLRIQLHPSCLPDEGYAHEEDEAGGYGAEDDDEGYDGFRARPRFGEDLVLNEGVGGGDGGAGEGVWEGEWDGAEVRVVGR